MNAIVSGVNVSASVALLCASSSSRPETKSRIFCSNVSVLMQPLQALLDKVARLIE